MSDKILAGLCLVLVFEGILPFLSPDIWRKLMIQITQQSDQQIRVMGASSMALGVILLMLLR